MILTVMPRKNALFLFRLLYCILMSVVPLLNEFVSQCDADTRAKRLRMLFSK